jgi:golgi SNAP receptor complex member 2
MGDLQSLHTQARRLIITISAGLERLESAEQRGGASETLTMDLQRHLAQLQKISVDMDGMWRMQSLKEAASKRDLWKRKVEQVAEEADALRVGLERLNVRVRRRQAEEEQRQELLQRRVDGRPVGDLGAEVTARRHIYNSKAVLEEAYQTGVGVLGAMAGQRDRLKSAHRKALDVLNAVGLSDSVLRLAERRIAVDKLIAYGGMAGIVLFLVIIYWWLR